MSKVRARGSYMFDRAESEGRRAWRCWLRRHLSMLADVALLLLLPAVEALSSSCCRPKSMRLQGRTLSLGFELRGILVNEMV